MQQQRAPPAHHHSGIFPIAAVHYWASIASIKRPRRSPHVIKPSVENHPRRNPPPHANAMVAGIGANSWPRTDSTAAANACQHRYEAIFELLQRSVTERRRVQPASSNASSDPGHFNAVSWITTAVFDRMPPPSASIFRQASAKFTELCLHATVAFDEVIRAHRPRLLENCGSAGTEDFWPVPRGVSPLTCR